MTAHYVCYFSPGKQISKTEWLLPRVDLYDLIKRRFVHSYSFTRLLPSQSEINQMGSELVREIECGKIWSAFGKKIRKGQS